MFVRHVFPVGAIHALCAIGLASLYRPVWAHQVSNMEDLQEAFRFARCRATCIDKLGLKTGKDDVECTGDKECNMCWDVCDFFNKDFEVWKHMCTVAELCTQHHNATLSRSQMKQASELEIVALSAYGVFAHTRVDLDLDSEVFEAVQADSSVASVLPVFSAPKVVQLRHTSRHRVEVDVVWDFDLSPEDKEVKYEVMWRVLDKAVDVTGRLHTSQQSATLPLWVGTSYLIFVRRLSPATGEPDAETLSRFLDTPVAEPEPTAQDAASSCSERRRSRQGSLLSSSAKTLLGIHSGSGPSSPVGESREDLLAEAQCEGGGGTNQCFVYDNHTA
ncbi:hypothetical protein HPB49_015916 [Dermacentor silvarum]|uniref:Uncharacterized protein n=1 Tax=Dermacentor silvarum TaxID=543639 RepID=A0ACB8DEJ6_DERSI|nr:hypothetical protein HPB49_015916 [Dermacentor silvarum]